MRFHVLCVIVKVTIRSPWVLSHHLLLPDCHPDAPQISHLPDSPVLSGSSDTGVAHISFLTTNHNTGALPGVSCLFSRTLRGGFPVPPCSFQTMSPPSSCKSPGCHSSDAIGYGIHCPSSPCDPPTTVIYPGAPPAVHRRFGSWLTEEHESPACLQMAHLSVPQ